MKKEIKTSPETVTSKKTQAAEPERRTVRGASRETERRTGEVVQVAMDDLSPSVSSSQGTLPSNTSTL